MRAGSSFYPYRPKRIPCPNHMAPSFSVPVMTAAALVPLLMAAVETLPVVVAVLVALAVINFSQLYSSSMIQIDLPELLQLTV